MVPALVTLLRRGWSHVRGRRQDERPAPESTRHHHLGSAAPVGWPPPNLKAGSICARLDVAGGRLSSAPKVGYLVRIAQTLAAVGHDRPSADARTPPLTRPFRGFQ